MEKENHLIKEISGRKVDYGHLCFWWLGQHSFVVKTKRLIFYLDPFLSPHPKRMIPSLLNPDEVRNADFITASHDHDDHLDRHALPRIMKASPGCFLIAPKSTEGVIEEAGISSSRVFFMDDEEAIIHKDARITAVKSAHEFFDYDKNTGYPYLGYVIETDGVVFYHSGDTCIYDGLASWLETWRFTAVFLPINGRDAKRFRAGCIGNMTYQEAADLAGIIRPEITVPSHYDMFEFNREDPSLFAEYMDAKYHDLRYWIGEHGTAVEVY